MKLVINAHFGGFVIPDDIIDLLGVNSRYADVDRNDPVLIDYVENNPKDSGDLIVVEIPDAATDYYIDSYDGYEKVFYVVDGKIYIIYPEDFIEDDDEEE